MLLKSCTQYASKFRKLSSCRSEKCHFSLHSQRKAIPKNAGFDMGFTGGYNGKESVCNAGDPDSIPRSGRYLKKGMATHCCIIAWWNPWTEELSRLEYLGSQRVGHDWVTNTHHRGNRGQIANIHWLIEKEMQKSKMAAWGGLTNNCEKKGSKKQRRKGKICPFECRVPKNSKER